MWVATAFWAITSLLFWSLPDVKLNSLSRVGAGGLIGLATFFLISWVPRVTDTGFWVFSTHALLMTLICIAFYKVRPILSSRLLSFDFRTMLPSRFSLIFLPMILATAVAEIFISNGQPIFAWDALSMWARRAQLYSQYIDGGAGGEFRWAEHRHPLTLAYVMASLRYFDGTGQAPLSLFAPYFLAKCSMTLICAGAVTSSQHALRLITAFFAMTIPIVSNHVGIPGYADYWLALFSLCLIIIGTSYQSLTSKTYYMIGCLVLFVCTVLMKNLGWVLGVLAVVSIPIGNNLSKATICLEIRKRYANTSTVLLLLSLVFLATIFFILLNAAPPTLRIGGRILEPSIQAVSSIPASLIHAIFYNSSFTIIGLLVVFTALLNSRRLNSTEWALITYFAFTMALHFMIMGTEYGLRTTSESSDLGGTRFLMTPMLVMLVFTASRIGNFFLISLNGSDE